MHPQSSLEDGDFEAAAGFVETLAKLQNTASRGEVPTVREENEHFISARDAVADVIREKFNLAAHENDTIKVIDVYTPQGPGIFRSVDPDKRSFTNRLPGLCCPVHMCATWWTFPTY